MVLTSQDGEEHELLANLTRKYPVNTHGMKVLPILTTAGRNLRDMPTYEQAAILQNGGNNSGHSGNIRVMCRQLEKPLRSDQRAIMARAGVPDNKIAQYEREVDARVDGSVAYVGNMPATVVDPSRANGVHIR